MSYSSRADCLAFSIATCSFLENRSAKQLCTQPWTSLGPERYTSRDIIVPPGNAGVDAATLAFNIEAK